MDFDFKSKEELYQRVKPALKAKKMELKQLGISYIQEVDIWNYFIKEKWSQAKDLRLSDVVSDIMHADPKRLDLYIKEIFATAKRMTKNNLEVI